MGQPDYASNPADLGEGTLVELFLDAVDRLERHAALRYHRKGSWHRFTYRDVFDRVWAVTGGLSRAGLSRGDRAAILSPNRPEWALADYGCLCAGVVDVPIYSTLIPAQIQYILEDAGVRLIFLSDQEQLEKILEIRGDLPDLRKIVVFDPPEGELPEGVQGWKAFLKEGAEDLPGGSEDGFRAEALSAGPEDTATILYTSGTTGDPKGVMLSHNNLSSNVRAASQVLPLDHEDTTLSFLPLSHVFQRMVDYLLFSKGCTIAYARSLDTVPDDLKVVRPTVVVSVPRLYEKVYARVTATSGVKGVLATWARGVGSRWADRRLAGKEPPASLRLRYTLAHKLVFSKIAQGVGGRLRYFVSGGAPLAPEINKFFFSAGIMILEGYGLTETSPVTNVNTPRDFPNNFRIGTVGKPVPGTEIRIAEDGEILVRGPQVMKGYYNRPEATREVMDDEGWFHTGDVGELDEDGFLRITDRKKDIIVTAGGKNVAPQPIENVLKQNRFFDQPVLVGDRERFITLLVVPDFDAVSEWAGGEGIPTGDRREMLGDERVGRKLLSEMQDSLRELARFETPKKLVLLDSPFTIEDGSLTPTQKVKRRVVQERFEEILRQVYDEGMEGQDVFLGW